MACGELLVAVLRERDRLDAAAHRPVVLADRAGTARADGAASMAAWLRWRCRLAPDEAARAGPHRAAAGRGAGHRQGRRTDLDNLTSREYIHMESVGLTSVASLTATWEVRC